MSVNLFNTPSTKSQWLCIGTQNIHQQLRPLLDAINNQFTKINHISGWSLNDPDKSHITLYMGWNSSLNQNLQEDLLTRISHVIAETPAFDLILTPHNTSINISDNYVILKVADPTLNFLQKKVQEVTKRFIQEKNLPQNGTWFDKDYKLHLSLGSIDNQSRSVNNKLSGKYRATWRDNLLNSHLQHPITQKIESIDLFGVNDPSLLKEEKNYYTLGQVNLLKSSVDGCDFSFRAKDLRRNLNAISNKGNVTDLKLGYEINQVTHKRDTFIEVSFDNKQDAQIILQEANLGNKIYSQNGTHMIRLGRKRLQNLFPDIGSQLYSDIVKRLT